MTKILSFILLLAFFSVNAQDCQSYFPQTEGSTLTYAYFNKKDKLQSSSKITILEITGQTTKIKQEHFDKKGKPTHTSEYEANCQDGVFTVSMESMLNDEMIAAFQNMEITIDGDDLSFPKDPKVGQTLKDASIKVSVSTSGFTMGNITMDVTNREVAGMEDLTVTGGTYSCAKLTYDFQSKVLFVKVSGKATTWYAENIGMVREESYDDKGNLRGYSVLTKVE